MKKILSQKIAKILRNKKKLEKELRLKITNKEKEITIEGNSESEYFGEKVIDAINFGFPLSHSLSIKKENKDFERINIKDHTKSKDLERIRGRIIGKGGKGLKTMSNLTNCYLEIKDNEVGIIGNPEDIKNATEAIISMIKGSKHGNVYSFLEKNKPKPIHDLGLKK